jgi:toxin ParE1/3/4
VKLLWLAQARIEFRQIAEGLAIERPQVANGF